MQNDLIIQQPAEPDADDAELLLLFHGVGSDAENLRLFGQALAPHRPRAWVISVRAPDRSDFGYGWQWFSVDGITDANRPARIAACMPTFRHVVAGWQKHSGMLAARTTLVGFSQGAIMALESTQHSEPALANRVIAIAGRFAQQPIRAPAGTVVHLMHGEADSVMPVGLAAEAHAQLQALGVCSTLDRFHGLGHEIDARVVDAIVKRLGERQEACQR